MTPRLEYWAAAPEIMQALLSLNTTIETSGLERSLIHLVKLRASQMNGCAYCIEMHTREARKDGESEARMHLVAAWRDSYLFTAREVAALEWTEALTSLADHAAVAAAFDKMAAQFDPAEQAKLTAVVTMINTWNRFSVGFQIPHAEPAPMAA